ncbi:MAG: prefoldin subunit alpha [Crenarchaeota archaeon]|nr:prefoldin subunit alpha [Thermoproteota archaeon]
MSEQAPGGERRITEADIARLVEELEVLESTAQALRQDIAVLSASIAELKSTRTLIKMLADGQKIEESYTTIGGGVFVKTRIEDYEKVLVNVGANYVVELNVKDALDHVDRRIRELEDVKSRLELRLAEVVRRIENIRQFLAAVYAMMRGGAEGKAERK